MNTSDDFTRDEWLQAEPMNLRAGANSVEAIGLVEGILDALSFAAPAKLLKPSTAEKRRTAVRALMAALLKLEARGVAGYHGMSPKDLPSKLLGFGYDIFLPVKDAMVDVGFLSFSGGHQRVVSMTNLETGAKGDVAKHSGYQARFRLTRRALEEVEKAGIRLDAWDDHWSRPEPLQSKADLSKPSRPLIELRASKDRLGGKRRKGVDLPVDMSSPTAQAILADLQEHNAFLRDIGVAGVDFVGLRRIFNNADEPDYAWNKGGRFYSLRVGSMGTAYENLKGDKRRRRIRLGGEAVGEVDMSASQLRLLYGLLAESLPAALSDDLYCIPGVHRYAIKLAITQAIGKESVRSKRWGPEAVGEYAKNHDKASLEADHPFGPTLEAVLEWHTILKRLGGTGCPSALELQYVESEIIRHAMALLRKDGIPSLPVHDSLIVPTSKMDRAEQALQKAFKAQVEAVIGYLTTILPKTNWKCLTVAPPEPRSIRV